MEVSFKYAVGSKLYRLENNSEVIVYTVISAHVFVEGENGSQINTQYRILRDGHTSPSFYWESDVDKKFFTSIEEMKKDAMMKLLNI